MKKILDLLSDKKVKLTLIGVLVVLFILIMAVSIARNKNKDKEEEPPAPTQIVVDDNMKNKLKNYIAELSTGPYCEIPTNQEFANDCVYRNNSTLKENLTVTYRINSLVLAIGNTKENNIMVGNITANGKSFSNPHYVDLEEVEKEYKLLYGKEDTFSPETVNNISVYNIRYDEEKKKFFYQIPDTPNFVDIYIEKYESTTEDVTVYVRAGYISYEFYKYHLYNNKGKEREIVAQTTREYKEGNIINDANYQELPQYKIKFTKEADSDNVVFTSVELVG